MVPFCYDFGTDVSTNKHRFGYFTMILFYDLDNNIIWKNVVGFINILSKHIYITRREVYKHVIYIHIYTPTHATNIVHAKNHRNKYFCRQDYTAVTH